MRKAIYTLWKAKNGGADAILLEHEPMFKTKFMAFRKAKKLAINLVKGWDNVILVREIKENTNICKEWEFTTEGDEK